MNDLEENRLLRIHDVLGDKRRGVAPLIPVGMTAWWCGIRAGRFPPPLKLGRTAVWRAKDIRAVLDGTWGMEGAK